MLKRKMESSLLSVTALFGITAFEQAFAQGAPDGMAMTLLPVIHEHSHEFIITPRGYKVQIPGTGLARNASQVAVYQDPQQNFWYINKRGEPTQVPPNVMQSVYAQVQAQMNGSVPGAPAGSSQAPVQQTTIVQQPSTTGAGAAALGAFAGAATGAALTNPAPYYNHPYYGVPYGKPVYHGGVNNSGNSYYYYNNGQKQYVNANNNNQKVFSEFNKQGNWNERNTWSKNLQAGSGAAASTAANNQAGEHEGRRGLLGGRRDGESRAGGGFRRRGR